MVSKFGNKLVELRKAKNYTLREAAKRIGIDFTLLSRYESGDRRLASPAIRPEAKAIIRRIADAYKTNEFDPYNELMALAILPDDSEEELVKSVTEQFARTFGDSAQQGENKSGYNKRRRTPGL